MISIHLEGDSVLDLHQQMLALLAGHSGVSPATTENPPTTTGGKRSSKKTETKQEPDAGKADTTGSEEGAGAPTGQSSAAGEITGPITKESLSPRVLALGQKLGLPAVQELFSEFGASKFSEVPVEQYAALNARLDQLLA